jgi:outer membrane protein TolC
LDPTAPPGAVTAVRFGSDNTWTAGLSFDQPLFEYGLFIGVGAAGQFRGLEAERVRGTTQGVVSAVRQAYLAALLAAEDVRLTDNSVERTRSTLQETQALYRAGLASSYDALRLEVQLANLEPNLRRAQNRLAAAKRTLLIEMGLEPREPIELEGRLNEVNVLEPEQDEAGNALMLAVSGLPVQGEPQFDELYEIALSRRSNLRQIRRNIAFEETRLRSQKAEYFPTLSLFSSYNITAQEDGNPTFFGTPNSRTTAVVTGVRISIPVFQGFSRDARVQQTAATVRQNEAQLERFEKEAENELRTVLENLAEARLRVASQSRAVEQAQRGFEIASAEYREGLGSQLQITDAENALRESEFNHAQAVYDYLVARMELDAAIGAVPVAAGDLAVRVNDRGK